MHCQRFKRARFERPFTGRRASSANSSANIYSGNPSVP
ncbi:hypothetical protein PUN4_520131 [Paraburkholderia unamae]|nr:hypothetical protein PUN4_520131 [Paraburkholderia unamae]